MKEGIILLRMVYMLIFFNINISLYLTFPSSLSCNRKKNIQIMHRFLPQPRIASEVFPNLRLCGTPSLPSSQVVFLSAKLEEKNI